MRTLVVLALVAPSALAVLSMAPGCTFVVVQDIQRAACDVDGDCAAGLACRESACTPIEDAAVPPPPGVLVGSDGGVVEGPDGVTLDVPAGALDRDVRIRIERRSSTTIAAGVDERSRFYAIDPDFELAQAAVLSVPLVDDAECDPCAVFIAPEEEGTPWGPLPDVGGATPVGFATAELPLLGAVVVAGEVAP